VKGATHLPAIYAHEDLETKCVAPTKIYITEHLVVFPLGN